MRISLLHPASDAKFQGARSNVHMQGQGHAAMSASFDQATSIYKPSASKPMHICKLVLVT